MRVKLIVPCKGPNPRYDWTRTQAENMHPPEVDVPIGHVLDGPRVWIFMKNGQAEPEDDEAREWWEKHVGRMAQHQAAVAALRDEQAAKAAEFDDEGDDDDDD